MISDIGYPLLWSMTRLGKDFDHCDEPRGIRNRQTPLRARGLPGACRLRQEHDHRCGADGRGDPGCVGGGWSDAADARAHPVGAAGGVPYIVVFLNKVDVVDDPELLDLVATASGSATRGRRGLGREALAMSVAPPEAGRNRIMIYGPKPDGTYIVEFKIADGEALAFSVPAGETRVLKYFQERMPYGLFVPDVSA